MKKIMQPCGLHCIKMQDIGVTIGEQNILQHVNLHIHCGTLAAVIGKTVQVNPRSSGPFSEIFHTQEPLNSKSGKWTYAEDAHRLCATISEY